MANPVIAKDKKKKRNAANNGQDHWNNAGSMGVPGETKKL